MNVGILHYTSPPVTGGVEAVILAHARQLIDLGVNVTMISGRGDLSTVLPVKNITLPLLDSLHPEILEATGQLNLGQLPQNFEEIKTNIAKSMMDCLQGLDHLIIHNVFTKHFNLPLTAALVDLHQQDRLPPAIIWCHDLSWTSPNSKQYVFPGYPWDYLRQTLSGCAYVAISQARQREMVNLFHIEADKIHLVYNGVDEHELLAISPQDQELFSSLSLDDAELLILLPVRVTKAKNIEFALDLLVAWVEMGLNPKLIITGPPDPHAEDGQSYYQELTGRAKQLGLDKHVQFIYDLQSEHSKHTLLNYDSVATLYRYCDFLLMPSHREGFGMPVIEAGLAGIPVVTTPIPASLELAEENVYIIDAHKSPPTTAAEISHWLNQQPTFRQKKYIRQNMTWRAIAKRKLLPILHMTNRR